VRVGTAVGRSRRRLLVGGAAVVLASAVAAGTPSPPGAEPARAAVAPATATPPTPAAATEPEPAGPAAAAGTTGATAASRARADADASVLDALAPDAPPRTVPYAIGTRIYFAGRVSDLADRFATAFPGTRPGPAQRQFTTVVGAAGFAWAQFTGSGVDVVSVVDRVGPDGAVTPFHASTGRASLLAVTTGGLVAMPESGQVFTTAGRAAGAFTGSVNIDCGSCAPTAAGPRLVIDQWSGTGSQPEHQATWLWYPPVAIQRLDDRFRAVGRLGSGWLGLDLGGGCWRLAPATAPDRLGAPVCSQATPLVSADGARAVVVQGGRVRVVEAATGATVSVASLTPLARWDPLGPHPRYAVPAVWETADAYLVTARVDGTLALVRCSARTGACRRAVRVAVRPGVDRIVTERGPADAVPAG